MLVMALATMTALAQDEANQAASAPAETLTLDLSRGTYQLGGSATANIALLPDAAESQTDVYLLLSPQGGYFIVDRVELFVGVDLLVDETGLEVGVFAGFDYFLPGTWVAPYLGVGAGYGTRQLDELPVLYSELAVFTATAHGGLMLPLGRHVGFDLGVEVNLNLAQDQTWLTLPMGYTGIRAFFK